MRLQFPQLATSLKQGLAPVFLICGDEPFQLGEAASLIRQAARAGGFEEREVLEVDGHFDWGRLMAVARSLSLFSSRKLIELRLASGKIGREGGEAVRDYCARPLAAESAIENYRAFASEMQATTTTGDETVYGILQLAESYGVSGDAAERAAKNAIGAAAAFNVDEAAAIKMTAALEQGQTTLLQRYMPALRQIEDPAQKAAYAQAELAKAFGVAVAEGDSFQGAMAKLNNAVGDVKEGIGAVIADALQPLATAATGWAQSFTQMSDSTKTVIAYTGMATAGLAGFVATAGGVVAAAGQMTIWYGALQKSATGAKVAQLALNSATMAGTLEISRPGSGWPRWSGPRPRPGQRSLGRRRRRSAGSACRAPRVRPRR